MRGAQWPWEWELEQEEKTLNEYLQNHQSEWRAASVASSSFCRGSRASRKDATVVATAPATEKPELGSGGGPGGQRPSTTGTIQRRALRFSSPGHCHWPLVHRQARAGSGSFWDADHEGEIGHHGTVANSNSALNLEVQS